MLKTGPGELRLKLADLWTDRGLMNVLADGCSIVDCGGWQAQRHSCCRCVARAVEAKVTFSWSCDGRT